MRPHEIEAAEEYDGIFKIMGHGSIPYGLSIRIRQWMLRHIPPSDTGFKIAGDMGGGICYIVHSASRLKKQVRYDAQTYEAYRRIHARV